MILKPGDIYATRNGAIIQILSAELGECARAIIICPAKRARYIYKKDFHFLLLSGGRGGAHGRGYDIVKNITEEEKEKEFKPGDYVLFTNPGGWAWNTDEDLEFSDVYGIIEGITEGGNMLEIKLFTLANNKPCGLNHGDLGGEHPINITKENTYLKKIYRNELIEKQKEYTKHQQKKGV